MRHFFNLNRKVSFIIISAILAVILCSVTASAQSIPSTDSTVVYRHDNSSKKIALTFDDGPHYKYTAEILDILKEYGAKATFFVVGELAERYPELVSREIAEGHEVGNHTWSHPKMAKLTSAQLTSEILRTERLLNEIADYRPKLFRPPEGSVEQIVEMVISETEAGSIILCHDFIGRDSPTPDALRKFIPALLDKGFEFVTVSELLASE